MKAYDSAQRDRRKYDTTILGMNAMWRWMSRAEGSWKPPGSQVDSKLKQKNLPSLQYPFLSILRVHLRWVSHQCPLIIFFHLPEVLLEEQISDRQSRLHPYSRCVALGNELHSHWDQERPVLCQLPWQQHSSMDLQMKRTLPYWLFEGLLAQVLVRVGQQNEV